MKILGVYRNGDEFGISDGRHIFWLFPGQSFLDENVDLNQGTARETDYVIFTHGNSQVGIRDDATNQIIATYNVNPEVVESLVKLKRAMTGF